MVALTTIDAVVEALAPQRLDFIKADIEGWELRLLLGGEHALRRFRPRLLLELSEEHLARAGDRRDDAFAFLAQLGYRAFSRDAGGALVPAAGAPDDGDFWFIAAGDPVIGLLPEPAPTRVAAT
jgi:hypothetical protein